MKKTITDKDIRIFGSIWACILFVLIAFDKVHNQCLLLVISVALFYLTVSLLYKPILLKYPFKVWLKLGELMNKIISKIIIFILYYLIFVPIGLIAKLSGKDFLDKKINLDINSYWLDRTEAPSEMKNQF